MLPNWSISFPLLPCRIYCKKKCDDPNIKMTFSNLLSLYVTTVYEFTL